MIERKRSGELGNYKCTFQVPWSSATVWLQKKSDNIGKYHSPKIFLSISIKFLWISMGQHDLYYSVE